MGEKSGKRRDRAAKHKLEVLKDRLTSRLQPIKVLTPSAPRPEPT